MIDLEKVKQGLKHCLKPCGTCDGCPYESSGHSTIGGKDCMEILQRDALKLLKRDTSKLLKMLKEAENDGQRASS